MDPSHGLSQYAPGGMLSPGKMQTVEELRDALRMSMKELIAVQVRVLLFPTKQNSLKLQSARRMNGWPILQRLGILVTIIPLRHRTRYCLLDPMRPKLRGDEENHFSLQCLFENFALGLKAVHGPFPA